MDKSALVQRQFLKPCGHWTTLLK